MKTESIEVTSRAEWRSWLRRNHRQVGGVWVVCYRKHVAELYVGVDALVEEALCFGWVDSKGRALDARRTMLWFAPRKARSGWSRINKERVARLIAADRMTAAGLAKIEAAKADGSWAALDAVEALVIPPDLAAAFKAHPPARTNFDQFPRSVRRSILEWISTAKQPATRGRRINETATLAAKNVRANQWREPKGRSSPPA